MFNPTPTNIDEVWNEILYIAESEFEELTPIEATNKMEKLLSTRLTHHRIPYTNIQVSNYINNNAQICET